MTQVNIVKKFQVFWYNEDDAHAIPRPMYIEPFLLEKDAELKAKEEASYIDNKDGAYFVLPVYVKLRRTLL